MPPSTVWDEFSFRVVLPAPPIVGFLVHPAICCNRIVIINYYLEADVKEAEYSWIQLKRLERTGMPDGIILAAYAPGGATTALID